MTVIEEFLDDGKFTDELHKHLYLLSVEEIKRIRLKSGTLVFLGFLIL